MWNEITHPSPNFQQCNWSLGMQALASEASDHSRSRPHKRGKFQGSQFSLAWKVLDWHVCYKSTHLKFQKLYNSSPGKFKKCFPSLACYFTDGKAWEWISNFIPHFSYDGCNIDPCFNSLRPSDALWQQRSGSTLVQVMACCLMAPSHYLNQCWLIISEVQWRSY